MTTRRIYADAVDALMARIGSSNDEDWYLTDLLGSVRDIADSTGSAINHLDYNTFGGVATETSPTDGDRYAWTGRERDVETGLQYNRARWYDPASKRWLSQDPMDFDAGDSNLYRYATNSAASSTDPSGLDPFDRFRSMNLSADQQRAINDYREHYKQLKVVYGPVLADIKMEQLLHPIGTHLKIQQQAREIAATNEANRAAAGDISLGFPGLSAISDNYIPEETRDWYRAQQQKEADDYFRYNANYSLGEQNNLGFWLQLIGPQTVSGCGNLWNGICLGGGAFLIQPPQIAKPLQTPAIVPVAPVGPTLPNTTRGWRVGQPINNLTSAGNVPSWTAVRQRFWKNETHFNPGNYNADNLARMQRGLAPQRVNPRTGQLESMELHHTPPQRDGGLFDVRPVWPDDHALIDPFRRTGN